MDFIKATLAHSELNLALLISTGLGYTFLRKLQQARWEKLEKGERPCRLIVITGCDSGLGLSMAFWAGHLGYKVLAGCLDPNSEGAEYLRKEFECDNNNNIKIAKLDVTDEESILQFRMECQELLKQTKTKLWAVISNAAVLVLGEFFWETKNQRERQMKVNYEGAVNLTSAFRPLLFQHRCRLIIVTSDCAEHALPGLSSYAASKSALQSWATALRLEVFKYGISVVCYQPGDFPKDTQMLSNTAVNFLEMEASMLEEDKEFYGDYYHQWKEQKLNFFSTSNPIPIKPINKNQMKKDFIYLLEGNIKNVSVFKRETAFQKVVHFVLNYFPTRFSDAFVCLLMNFGTHWDSSKSYEAYDLLSHE